MTANNAHKEISDKIRPSVLIFLFIVVATLVVYGQVSNYEFVGFDDDLFIMDNPRMQNGLTLGSVERAFSYDNIAYWHPLTWLSYMLDIQLYGMNPGRHHMTNVLIHIINAMLLFMALNRTTGALWKSALVASLFALHPLNVESVAWVVERKNVLSTMFWMLTMLTYALYVKRPVVYRYLLTLVLFTIGLLAKPMLVTLPFVLLLLDYWPLGRLRFGKLDVKATGYQESHTLRVFLEKVPFLVISGISIYLSSLSLQNKGIFISLESTPLSLRIANALVSYVGYIWKMIWPRNLAVFYPYPEMVPLWKVIGAFLFLISITVGVILKLRKQPYLAVGWFWYLGTLIPVIGLVKAGLWPAMADRFAYVPLIGLFVIIAWGIAELASGLRYRRAALATSTAVLLLILMITAWLQVRYWKNSVTLFKRAVDVTANNYLMHGNLGFALTARGRADEAIKHYKEALRIKPNNENIHLNLGIALLSQGKPDECIDYYNEVLSSKPELATVHNNLGVVLLWKGRMDEAIIHFQKAISIEPNYAEAYNSLGTALVHKGEIDKAIVFFRKALSLKPGFVTAQKNLRKVRAAQKKTGNVNTVIRNPL
jgi:tetratricopeptide (TPR) repeat protein